MIISGGVNIYPAEIEAVLLTHPKVGDVAVFGIPHEDWGEEVKAVDRARRRRRAAAPALADEILAFCADAHRQVQVARSRSTSSPRCRATRTASSTSASCATRTGTAASARSEPRAAWTSHSATSRRSFAPWCGASSRSTRRRPRCSALAETPAGFDRGSGSRWPKSWDCRAAHLPEAYGGQGFGFLELGIALEEMGRVLLPRRSSRRGCLAAHAILTRGSEAQSARCCPASRAARRSRRSRCSKPGGDWDPESIRLAAETDGGGFASRARSASCSTPRTRICSWSRRAARERADAAGVALFAVRRDAPG